ncbi:MAG: copper amine oxidase N-terminal domain-containing protein [Marinisporobacter sp.]|nr:copper amine oxidase N-terminal domain-containing protein [Marinisporobacter sp.]
MKKKLCIGVLLVLMLNVQWVFANELSDNISDNLLQLKILFPEKSDEMMNKIKEHIKTEDGKEVISDKGIESLKEEVDSFLDETEKELLKEDGITTDVIKESIDVLKEWDEEQRVVFVESIEKNDKEKITEIVEKEKIPEIVKENNLDNKKVTIKKSSSSSSSNASIKIKENRKQIKRSAMDALAKENKPLEVKLNGVKLKFDSKALLTIEGLESDDLMLEIEVRELNKSEKEKLLKNILEDKKSGLFEIGEKIFDLSAKLVETNDNTRKVKEIKTFSEPVEVTIDLWDINLKEEEINKLTGVRYEKDENNDIDLVKLGGTYDLKTKSFTFYTDKFSNYSVLKTDKISTISITIDNFVSKVNHKDQINDVAPTIINNRTMVPIRFIAENLGAEVAWDGKTRTVTVHMDGKALNMVIDKPIEDFDTPPTIMNNRTFVPIRYISEKLGGSVLWFPSNKTVYIVK